MNNQAIADIATINDIAGNKANQGWKAVHHQLKIILSEVQEMTDAVEAHDIVELRDGVADVLFTIYGLTHRAGLNSAEDLQEVIDSNWSKFDTTHKAALLTQAKYAKLGVVTQMRLYPEGVSDPSEATYIVTVSAKDQTDVNGKSYPEGKYLKSAAWKEPVFEGLEPDNLLLVS